MEHAGDIQGTASDVWQAGSPPCLGILSPGCAWAQGRLPREGAL